jgi:chromosome condensin MukBEF complex kleisin-like MukF subunit
MTVADLVAGIERRQRGLDAQQEAVQAEIATLLSADWFSAVDRCQSLLDATTSTRVPRWTVSEFGIGSVVSGSEDRLGGSG